MILAVVHQASNLVRLAAVAIFVGPPIVGSIVFGLIAARRANRKDK